MIVATAAFILIIIAAITIYTLKLNSWRNSLEYNFNLYPNCLLTQYPILILTGKTSLFYKGRYWNCLPDWLESHGYEVLELSFSSNSDTKREKEVVEFLRLSIGVNFHILADESNLHLLQSLSRKNLNSVKSMTICGNNIELKDYPEIQILKLDELQSSQKRSIWKTTALFHKILTNNQLNTPSLCLPDNETNNFLVRNYLSWAISLAEKDLS